jgi:hypothetical protein
MKVDIEGLCDGLMRNLVLPELNFNMRLIPDSPALRTWRPWVGAVIVAEVCWFALLHPRIAGDLRAVLALALLPLAVVGYVYLMVAVSVYLGDREWDLRLRQMTVMMLGLSVGWFVFALLWLAKVHFESQLG